ncbi:AMP-binding enzyme [Mycobacterium palustre]|uniref:AMP-binding enzyme n=2 Tax=Mycobacterium palustre TaxID=153971 RepID=UPI0031841DE6
MKTPQRGAFVRDRCGWRSAPALSAAGPRHRLTSHSPPAGEHGPGVLGLPARGRMCACAVSDVHDVGVVVVTDEQWGEVGLAAVVAEPAAVVTLDSFDAFAAQRLARHKLPKRLVLVDAAHIDRP